MESEAIKVIFVAAGSGRSGSTLLARLIGEIDGCMNVGELKQLVNGWVNHSSFPCGCGEPLDSCVFWKDVGKVVPDDVQEYAKHWVRTRWFPLYLVGCRGMPFSGRFEELLQALQSTIEEIAFHAGRQIIVDCSKSPTYLYALAQLSRIELYVLHLVRSPQTVAMSWRRKKGYLKRQSVLKTLVSWSLDNICFEWMGRRARWYRRIRFEDFVERPREILGSVTEQILGHPTDLPFTDSHRVFLHEQHHLAGNPDKLTSGEIVIRGNTAIPATLGTRILTRVLTFPLLWHYGYL